MWFWVGFWALMTHNFTSNYVLNFLANKTFNGFIKSLSHFLHMVNKLDCPDHQHTTYSFAYTHTVRAHRNTRKTLFLFLPLDCGNLRGLFMIYGKKAKRGGSACVPETHTHTQNGQKKAEKAFFPPFSSKRDLSLSCYRMWEFPKYSPTGNSPFWDAF